MHGFQSLKAEPAGPRRIEFQNREILKANAGRLWNTVNDHIPITVGDEPPQSGKQVLELVTIW
jgi:hypothetical protein